MARFLLFLALSVLLNPAPALARTRRDPGECVHIERVAAFATQDEVYVEILANCDESDFRWEDPVLVNLEVLVGDLHPAGDEVRIYSDDSDPHLTFVFRDLEFARGDPLLVRIVRFGKILSLQSIRVR